MIIKIFLKDAVIEATEGVKVVVEGADTDPNIDLHYTFTEEGLIVDAIESDSKSGSNKVVGSEAYEYHEACRRLAPWCY